VAVPLIFLPGINICPMAKKTKCHREQGSTGPFIDKELLIKLAVELFTAAIRIGMFDYLFNQ